MGHMGGLINPRPRRGQYRAGFSNTGGSPKPQKRVPCQFYSKPRFWVLQLIYVQKGPKISEFTRPRNAGQPANWYIGFPMLDNFKILSMKN